MINLQQLEECANRIQSQRVLVVDDDAVFSKLVKAMIEQCGVQADVALSGKEALRKVVGQAYNLIFLDLRMPEMDGVEFTIECRSRGITVPIVIITGLTMGPLVEKAMTQDVAHFLFKPITQELVQQTLREFNLIGYGTKST